jgi:hypothetical protein
MLEDLDWEDTYSLQVAKDSFFTDLKLMKIILQNHVML